MILIRKTGQINQCRVLLLTLENHIHTDHLELYKVHRHTETQEHTQRDTHTHTGSHTGTHRDTHRDTHTGSHTGLHTGTHTGACTQMYKETAEYEESHHVLEKYTECHFISSTGEEVPKIFEMIQ